MKQDANECRERAMMCEREAQLTTTRGRQLLVLDMAQHWREMAELADMLEGGTHTDDALNTSY